VSSNDIPWNETIKKEARGIDDADFGEIQSVDPEYIITQKGIIDKEIFSFPISLAQDYDGNRVLFKVTEEEARNSYMQSQNVDGSSNGGIETETSTTTYDDESLSKIKKEEEIVIPLMGEELVVTKKELQDEITITKEPVRETKTEQVQLIHEEIEIERRPVNNLSNSSDYTITSISKDVHPVESKTEIKIPLKREETEVTKKPYIIEELVVRKKAVTKTQTVSEEIITERIIEPEV
jgi:uncharacterized protein (TIGR02271 family)